VVVACLIGASLVAVSFLAVAQENIEEKPVERALEAAGAYDLVTQLSSALVNGLEMEINPDNAAVIELIRVEFSDETELRDGLDQVVVSMVNEEQLREVAEWYETPLGRKIRMHEQRMMKPEAGIELQKFAARLWDNPARRERLDLCRKMEDQIQSAEHADQVSQSILSGLESSLAAGLEKAPPDVGSVERAKPADSAEEMRRVAVVTCLYTYEGLTDEELQQYLSLLSSPSGKVFVDAVWAGLSQAFRMAGENAGRRILEALKPKQTGN
jgi:hypothetical protein